MYHSLVTSQYKACKVNFTRPSLFLGLLTYLTELQWRFYYNLYLYTLVWLVSLSIFEIIFKKLSHVKWTLVDRIDRPSFRVAFDNRKKSSVSFYEINVKMRNQVELENGYFNNLLDLYSVAHWR